MDFTGAPQRNLTLFDRHLDRVVARDETCALDNDEELRLHRWMATDGTASFEPNDNDGPCAVDASEVIDRRPVALEAIDGRTGRTWELQNLHATQCPSACARLFRRRRDVLVVAEEVGRVPLPL